MSCFYTGFDYKNRKNGYFKIGETSKTAGTRASQISQGDAFMLLMWTDLPDATKAQRMYIEAYVRMKMAEEPDLTHTQNDHFLYSITQGQKYAQAMTLAARAIAYAKEAATQCGLTWTVRINTDAERKG